MYFSNDEKRILIEEALQTGTSLENFKRIIFDMIPTFKTLNISHDQPAHRYDIITHTYYVVQGVSDNRLVKLAALFHDIGKPTAKFRGQDGVYHYWGHPDISYEMTYEIMKCLEYDEETIEIVTSMVKYHDTYINKTDELFDIVVNQIKPENMHLFCELQISDLNAHTEKYAQKHREQTTAAHADYIKRAEKLL